MVGKKVESGGRDIVEGRRVQTSSGRRREVEEREKEDRAKICDEMRKKQEEERRPINYKRVGMGDKGEREKSGFEEDKSDRYEKNIGENHRDRIR